MSHRQKIVGRQGTHVCVCSCGFTSAPYLDRDGCDRAWGAHLRNVLGPEIADLEVDDQTGVTEVIYQGLTHHCDDPDCHVPGFVATLPLLTA